MANNKTLNAFLIRHGQTFANREGAAQGQTDSPVTPEGAGETKRKAEKLRGHVIHAVYCSDLPRAAATMEIIRSVLAGLPEPEFTPQLREIDFGGYSGMEKERLMPIIARHKADTSLHYPNGECGNDLIGRTNGFFKMLISKHMGQTALVVSHYGIMETAARLFAGYPPGQKIIIGGDDVWRMEFDESGRAKLKII